MPGRRGNETDRARSSGARGRAPTGRRRCAPSLPAFRPTRREVCCPHRGGDGEHEWRANFGAADLSGMDFSGRNLRAAFSPSRLHVAAMRLMGAQRTLRGAGPSSRAVRIASPVGYPLRDQVDFQARSVAVFEEN
jgi:hypothetical protein